MRLKYSLFSICSWMRRLFKNLIRLFSYLPLILSGVICLTILFPVSLGRVPVLSYFISEHELPVKYELCGEVKVIDEHGNIINKNVEVFVGGYKTSIYNLTDFSLKFSSPTTNEIFVVIKYDVNGESYEYTKRLIIGEKDHKITEEFIVNV